MLKVGGSAGPSVQSPKRRTEMIAKNLSQARPSSLKKISCSERAISFELVGCLHVLQFSSIYNHN